MKRIPMPVPALLMWLACALPATAEVRAWLDRDRIGAGETATLNIQTDDPGVRTPDYSPLGRDFDVSGNTSSRQFEMINGATRTRLLFAVALQPRRDGALTIPPLRVGGEQTRPLTLQVTAAAPAPARAGGVVFIETRADADAPYVQQAVGYTVRLYYATSLISGQLDQDDPEGASLQRVGDDLQYQRDVGGKRYTVVERRYLLIPEHSGAITIPGARFRGQGVGGFFDDLFGDGQRNLSARAAPRTLQVRAMPDNAPQPWLPLNGLALQYLSAPQAARAGEAATVTVELRADGASGTQLPELELGGVDGAQVFADPPQVEESFEQGRPRVRVVRKFSVVPARAGHLRIPGPRMAWWDVRAGAQRTASLPDLALEVAAGAGGARDRNASASTAASASNSGQGDGGPWVRVPFVQGAVQPWALATVLFALLWLGTLFWALHRKPQASAPVRAGGADGAGAKAAARERGAATAPALGKALAGGDLVAITAALLAAAPSPAPDLDAVLRQLDDPAQREAVVALQRARWGQGDARQALSALRAAFAGAPQWKHADRARAPLLPPLYPQD